MAAVVAGRGTIERSDLTALFAIRAVAIVGQTLAFQLAVSMPDQWLPLLVLGSVCVLFVVASLLGLERIWRKAAIVEAVFFRQILIDVVVLTYLLALSGGTANPYHNLYVLQIMIVAVTLPPAYVWRALVASIACYVLLELVYVPIPDDRPGVSALIRFAELSDYVLIAVLMTYFVVRISNELRERSRQLAEAHQREVQAGCAISLGSAAAGAAHELATPLATISTLTSELHTISDDPPEFKRCIGLIEGCLDACQRSLNVFRSSADAWIQGGEAVTADRFIEIVTQRFCVMRPGAAITTDYIGTRPGPLIVQDLALQQAIVNLLNNAAFVSPLDIRLIVSWDVHELLVQVADSGPGISKELEVQLGRVFTSTKPPGAGNGVGLFLTHVTVSRLGGRLRLFNAGSGGAIAEIAVPLASLQVRAGIKPSTTGG